MNDQEAPLPIELRKQLLITQGAMYRSGIVSSKAAVVSGLRAESLAKSALKQIGLAAFALWRGRSAMSGGAVQAALPLVIGGVSKLWQQPKLKPMLRGALIAGAVASTIAVVSRLRKKSKPADEKKS
ncbi:MAG: hypothetical protein P4L91_12395 [Burkholderiaceae bacterium]|jgi:hypothetical protein|nr:hypothetical protein [Burkholderiaceae bacterium]